VQTPGQVQGSGEGSGEGLGDFGAEPGQDQQRSREGSSLVWPGLTRLQVGSGAIPGVYRRSFSVKFQQIADEKKCANNLLLLLGIPPKLILQFFGFRIWMKNMKLVQILL
jgi:hypothetical protein